MPQSREAKLDDKDVAILRRELIDLFQHIQKIRKEIAAIRSPGSDPDRFSEMTDELDAVIADTEQATQTIMEKAEDIDSIVQNAAKKAKDADQNELVRASENVGEIIVACSFQDITGQRVQKVVKSLKFIEERVNKLISMWGAHVINSENVDIEEETDPDKRLLSGPAKRGAAPSQEDIDRLLATGEAPPAKDVPTKKKEKKPEAAKTPPAEATPEPESDVAAMDQNDIDALFD